MLFRFIPACVGGMSGKVRPRPVPLAASLMDALGHLPPPLPEAALTIATMPALIASGRSGHASTMASRSGLATTQCGGAFWCSSWGTDRGGICRILT